MVTSAKEAQTSETNPVSEIIRGRLMELSVGREPDGKRPAFKHKRSKVGRPKGGYVSEEQLASLARHRGPTMFKLGEPRNWGDKACDKFIVRENRRCLGAAVKNGTRCLYHGGRRQRELNLLNAYADYKPDRALLGAGALRTMLREDMFPMELIRDVPQFAEAYMRARMGVRGDDPRFERMTYGERRLHHERCVVLCLGFIAAWDHVRVRGDYGPWTSCVRDAAALGIS